MVGPGVGWVGDVERAGIGMGKWWTLGGGKRRVSPPIYFLSKSEAITFHTSIHLHCT